MSKNKLLSMRQESKPESEPEPIKENKTNKDIRKEHFDAEKIEPYLNQKNIIIDQ